MFSSSSRRTSIPPGPGAVHDGVDHAAIGLQADGVEELAVDDAIPVPPGLAAEPGGQAVNPGGYGAQPLGTVVDGKE